MPHEAQPSPLGDVFCLPQTGARLVEHAAGLPLSPSGNPTQGRCSQPQFLPPHHPIPGSDSTSLPIFFSSTVSNRQKITQSRHLNTQRRDVNTQRRDVNRQSRDVNTQTRHVNRQGLVKNRQNCDVNTQRRDVNTQSRPVNTQRMVKNRQNCDVNRQSCPVNTQNEAKTKPFTSHRTVSPIRHSPFTLRNSLAYA